MTAAIVRRTPPLPPEWIPFEIAFEHPKLWRWVVLSVLLHVFAVLLFGAPSGGSREGRAMWGSLRVILQRRPEAPPPAPAPRSEPTPEAPPEPVAREARPEAAPIESFPPLLDRLPGLEPLPQITPLVIPPPTDVQVVPVPPPAPKPAAAPEPAPEPPAPAAIPAPAVPSLAPIPAPLLQPITPTIETSRLPSIERAPEIRVPAETPPVPAPLLQPVPQVQERSPLPPIERAPTIQAPAPEAIHPEAARPEPVRPEPVRPQPARPEAPRQESVRPEAARPEPVPGREPVTQMPAAPAPTESPFRRREDDAPSSTYDPTKPTLDAEALRKRASELARQGMGQRAPLAFPLPPVEKPKSKLESAIENARKPDCRDAYKGLGLLAVAPLIANEFGEGTCRW
jgi:hypothetical protein